MEESKVAKPLLKEFVRSLEGQLFEHDDLPFQRVNGFALNTYRLLVGVGYKQKDVCKLEHQSSTLIKEIVQDSTKIHKAWWKKLILLKL